MPEQDVLSGPAGVTQPSRWARLALFVIGRPPLLAREQLQMPLAARAYISGVFLLGLTSAAVTLYLSWGAAIERPWLLAVFALLAIFDRALQLTFKGHSLRFEEGLLVAMALLFPPYAVLLVFLISYLITLPTRRHISPWRSAFNFGILSGGLSAALGIMALLGLEPGQPFDWQSLVATLAGALTFYILSTLAVSMVLALAEGGHFRLKLPNELSTYLSFFSSSVALGLLTGAVALAYPWALPLALVAAYNLLQALVSRTRALRDREMLYGLLETTRKLQGAATRAELEALVLDSARGAFALSRGLSRR